jgi:hypothetical protein
MLQGKLQRQEEEEELQMRSNGRREAAVADNLEERINSARGNGQPLSNDIRGPMEQAFSADFSHVKVHTDAGADAMSQSIQARAFTTGNDIFFKGGEYNTGSLGGQHLLAHELTHTIQQTGKRELKTAKYDTDQSAQSEQTLSRAPTKQAPPVPTTRPWRNRTSGTRSKVPPPVPTNKPWRNKPSDKGGMLKIRELIEGGANLGGCLKGHSDGDIADFAAGARMWPGAIGRKIC